MSQAGSRALALVTGANRGIEFEVARQLGQQGFEVILGCRDATKGEQAAEKLRDEGLNAVALQLDVVDEVSIAGAREWVETERGVLDVLINNAAINYDTWQDVLSADLQQVTETLDVNTFGPWRMTLAFLPMLRKSRHPRVVNVSSGSGQLDSMTGSTPAYSLSKLALNGLTLMLASRLKREHVLVNSVCPGWVATDMGGTGGRPVAEGAAGIVWAATLPDDGPTGGFFRDEKPLPL